MAQALFLVSKTLEPGQEYVNGITAVLVNLVSTANAATAKAAAVAAANASELYHASQGSGVGNVEIGGLEDVIPSALPYFDTVTPASASGGQPGSGNLSANKDAYVFKTFGPQYIAGSSY